MSDTQFRGPIWGTTGNPVPFTGNLSGAQRVTDAHARFADSNLAGRIFSEGNTTLQAITAATYNISTLTATVTPIVGLWNPPTSGFNALILSATLNCIKTALQNTGCGPFFWAVSYGQLAITTGNTPLSRKTLNKAGSAMKGFSNGTAMTGLVGSLVVAGASALFGGSSVTAAFLETQAGTDAQHMAGRELFDGEWVIPPGGCIALLASTAPVAVSAAAMLVWEELPVLA